MIKISTLTHDSSRLSGQKNVADLTPGAEAVKMLISYSRALQVIKCNDFPTCFIVLN
jgi:hypothetical protein